MNNYIIILTLVCTIVALYSEIRFFIHKKEIKNPFVTFCWLFSAFIGFIYISILFVILIILSVIHDENWIKNKLYADIDTIISILFLAYLLYDVVELFINII